MLTSCWSIEFMFDQILNWNCILDQILILSADYAE